MRPSVSRMDAWAISGVGSALVERRVGQREGPHRERRQRVVGVEVAPVDDADRLLGAVVVDLGEQGVVLTGRTNISELWGRPSPSGEVPIRTRDASGRRSSTPLPWSAGSLTDRGEAVAGPAGGRGGCCRFPATGVHRGRPGSPGELVITARAGRGPTRRCAGSRGGRVPTGDHRHYWLGSVTVGSDDTMPSRRAIAVREAGPRWGASRSDRVVTARSGCTRRAEAHHVAGPSPLSSAAAVEHGSIGQTVGAGQGRRSTPSSAGTVGADVDHLRDRAGNQPVGRATGTADQERRPALHRTQRAVLAGCGHPARAQW